MDHIAYHDHQPLHVGLACLQINHDQPSGRGVVVHSVRPRSARGEDRNRWDDPKIRGSGYHFGQLNGEIDASKLHHRIA